MELFMILLLLIIFAETTFMTFLSVKKIKPTQNPKRKVYVDTSALIDGRILNIAQTGFIGDEIIIPRSVLKELQLLADNKDSEKRSRARAGLDIVNELERVVYFNTEILDDELDRTPVDERLLTLAKNNHGLILTLDFNLIKRANAEKIETLNVNDIALAVRNEFLPGEKATIKILEKGANKGQGIGHLADGTMVVVENADKKIGESLEVEFTHLHQTSAGKMIFAKRVSRSNSNRRR